MKFMLVVYFSHVLPAMCPRRYLYALEQVSVSSWLDRSRLPHGYITSDVDVNEDLPRFCTSKRSRDSVFKHSGIAVILSKQNRLC